MLRTEKKTHKDFGEQKNKNFFNRKAILFYMMLEALLRMVTPWAGVRGVILYVWRTLHDVTPLLVKSKKKGLCRNPPPP